MSLTVIKKITELEVSLRQQQEAALTAAKKNVAEAEREGLALVERLRLEAEMESLVCLKNAEEKAGREAEAQQKVAEQQCAALCELAMSRMDTAVALIVGRVVNS